MPSEILGAIHVASWSDRRQKLVAPVCLSADRTQDTHLPISWEESRRSPTGRWVVRVLEPVGFLTAKMKSVI